MNPDGKNSKKPGPSSVVRLHALELKLDEARDELAHLRGLVESLKADKEKLRQRVLQAASGTVCSRCGGDVGVVYIVRRTERGGRQPIDATVVSEALRRVAAGERVEAVALSL